MKLRAEKIMDEGSRKAQAIIRSTGATIIKARFPVSVSGGSATLEINGTAAALSEIISLVYLNLLYGFVVVEK
jgi:hypothetical protein